MRSCQATVERAARCQGIGLHSGVEASLSLLPAPPDHGIRVRRTDVAPGTGEIPVDLAHVVDNRLSTVVGNRHGVTAATVEHLMAALAGMDIDNAVVALDGPEIPAMDGSASPFVDLIERAGVHDQDSPRRAIRLRKPVCVGNGETSISMTPAESFSIDFQIEFDSPAIARQAKSVEFANGAFVDDIAPARTFGFIDDVDRLRRAGFARGASLDNAIAIDRARVVNRGGLRFDDEFVRHKILDCVGDLYLAGAPILAHVVALRSGHAANHELLRAMFADRESWTWWDIPQEANGLAAAAPAAG